MLDKYFPLYILIFIFTLSFTAILLKKLIPKLSLSARQPIYENGPRWHLAKSGTPTMGGLAFVIACSFAILPAALFAGIKGYSEAAVSVLLSFAYALANSAIGMVDDLKKLKNKRNDGLTPIQKLIFQTAFAILFLVMRELLLRDGTEISFSFGSIDLGWLYYPISLFILVGLVNSSNLTDGIDGLCASVAFSIGVSVFYISAALSLDGAILSSAVMGAAIGFLLFNLYPAKIFMGDTGSLFFGALIISSGFALSNPIIMIPIAAVYAFEGLSVVIQVVYYKLTHKRIFKMAPFHHHLEKCGWSENKICIAAMLTTLIFSIPVYVLYLP